MDVAVNQQIRTERPLQEATELVPVLKAIDDILVQLKEANDRRARLIEGSADGLRILGAQLRKLFPDLQLCEEDDDWQVAGVDVILSDDIKTTKLNFTVGGLIVAILDPVSGEARVFLDEATHHKESDQKHG